MTSYVSFESVLLACRNDVHFVGFQETIMNILRVLNWSYFKYLSCPRMKRHREDSEEEPLSKRINSLHLNGSIVPSSLASTSTASTSPHNHVSSVPAGINGAPTQSTHSNGMNGHHVTPPHHGAPIANGLHHTSNGTDNTSHRLLPESLNVQYPRANPTDNSNYFGFNKYLHDLHIEKLKRLGRIT